MYIQNCEKIYFKATLVHKSDMFFSLSFVRLGCIYETIVCISLTRCTPLKFHCVILHTYHRLLHFQTIVRDILQNDPGAQITFFFLSFVRLGCIYETCVCVSLSRCRVVSSTPLKLYKYWVILYTHHSVNYHVVNK